MTLLRKDLLGIEEISPEEIQLILDTAASFKEISTRPIKKVPTLRGRTIVNLFFESSTRTRASFEIAEKRLSADTLNFGSTGSSLSKGESMLDTVRNLEAMMHEHPTQALLDAFTIRERKGKLKGLKVAIIGDLSHSRVFRSNLLLLKKMEAQVVVAGPPTLIPPGTERMGAKVARTVEEAVEGADVVMMLRVQLERMKGGFFPSTREYFNIFGLTAKRLELARPDVILMHPGPMNRGIEIDSAVADGPHSVILDQVSHGVAVRMAVLYLLAGGGAEVKDGSTSTR